MPAMAVGDVRLRQPRFAERRSTRKAVLVWSFLAPSLLIFLLYRILPLGWNVVLSFEAWSPLKPAVFIGLENYQEMFTDDECSGRRSGTRSASSHPRLSASPWRSALALLVNSDIRGRDIYRTLIFLSYPLMTVAVAIIWRWMFDERVGLINYVARSFHLADSPIPFLNSFTWALPCVIVANIWQMLGFYMIILLTGLQTIPANLYEAAEIDGANAFRRFLRITLPLLKPSLFLCFVIGMLNSVTSFDLIYVMTNGGPGQRHRNPRHLYLQACVQPDPLRLCRGGYRRLLHPAAGGHLGREPALGRQCRRRGARLMIMRQRRWPIHLALDRGVLCHAGAVLLGAEDVGLRREHLLLSAQHHPARSPPVLLRRRLVCDSLRPLLPEQRDRVGADDHRQCRAERDGGLRADARYSRASSSC